MKKILLKIFGSAILIVISLASVAQPLKWTVVAPGVW